MVLFSCFYGNLIAGGGAPPGLVICRQLGISIALEVIQEGQAIPASWENIPMIREKLDHLLEQNPNELILINTMALVPGAPGIKSMPGLPKDYQDRRLFAIGRKPSFDFSSTQSEGTEGGRYYIAITADGSDTIAGWMPESQVKLIFQQIPGFDPADQPLPFENAEKLLREAKFRQKELENEVRKQFPPTRQRPGTNRPAYPPAAGVKAAIPASRAVEWAAAGLLATGLVFWYLRKRRKKAGSG